VVVYNRYFHIPLSGLSDVQKEKGLGILSPDHLREVGPRLPTEISLTDELAKVFTQENIPIPSPVTGFALIDTGASATAIDHQIAERMNIKSVGTRKVTTPSHQEPEEMPIFPVKISFPGTELSPVTIFATGVDIKSQNFIALIGRDLLKDCIFIYNGKGAHFTLSR